MKIFMIENETDNITVYTFAKEADTVKGAERFRNEAGLAKLAADWPLGRLVDIWNRLPGVTPVKKFKDRATAVARIWREIQGMGDAVTEAQNAVENAHTIALEAPQPPNIALQEANPATKATRAKRTAVAVFFEIPDRL